MAQVPISALLVFLIGRVTPGYGSERIIDTLIGAGIAVIAVLLSPSAPGPDAVLSKAQWLTFGMTLAMSQRILAEVGHPLDPAEQEPA